MNDDIPVVEPLLKESEISLMKDLGQKKDTLILTGSIDPGPITPTRKEKLTWSRIMNSEQNLKPASIRVVN